jgi:hypothetical protein
MHLLLRDELAAAISRASFREGSQVIDFSSTRAPGCTSGSGASADKSLRCTAEAPKVTLVRNGKRLEIRHLGFQFVGLLSARESSQARNP